MMDNGLDVPFQVRDLAAMSLDNIEKAFAQFLRSNKVDCSEFSGNHRPARTSDFSKNRLRSKACARERPYGSDRIAICILPSASRNYHRSYSNSFGFDCEPTCG